MNIWSFGKAIGVLFGILVFALSFNFLMYHTGTGAYVSYGCGDSMEPSYHAGDVLVYTEWSDINTGDVVRFQEEDNFIFHRVVEIDYSRDEPYRTKGDNNEYDDGWHSEDDINGVLVERIGNIEALCSVRY